MPIKSIFYACHVITLIYLFSQGTWMCINHKTCLTGYVTLWNLLRSLTMKMFVSLQLGGSIWYDLTWMENSRSINKSIHLNLLALTSERVLLKPCWYVFCFCVDVGCCDINFQYSAHVTDQIVNTFIFPCGRSAEMEWLSFLIRFVVYILISCTTITSDEHMLSCACFEALPTRP